MDDVQQAFETMLESEKGDSMTYKEFRHNLEVLHVSKNLYKLILFRILEKK